MNYKSYVFVIEYERGDYKSSWQTVYDVNEAKGAATQEELREIAVDLFKSHVGGEKILNILYADAETFYEKELNLMEKVADMIGEYRKGYIVSDVENANALRGLKNISLQEATWKVRRYLEKKSSK